MINPFFKEWTLVPKGVGLVQSKFFPLVDNLSFASTAIALGLLFSAAALRFPALTLNSFWLDEITTVWYALLPVEHLKWLIYDGHPPSFNILVRAWAYLFGTSEFALKTFPAFIGSITVPLCYLLFRKQLGEEVALAASILILFLPGHIYYSQELRAYSLAFLLALLATAALLVYLRKPTAKYRWLLALTCAGLLATHYLSILLILIVLLIAVMEIDAPWTTKAKKAEKLALTTFFVTSPFIAQLLIHQYIKRNKGYWLLGEDTVWDKLSETFLWLFQNQLILLWIYFALFLLALLHFRKLRDKFNSNENLVLGAVAILPIAVVLAFYFVTTNFLLVHRTILVFAAPMVLFAALGVTCFRSRVLSGFILVVVSTISLWWLVDSSYYTIATKSDWRGAAQEIARIERQHGEILLVNLGKYNVHRKTRSPTSMKEGKLQYYFDMFNVRSELVDVPKESSSTQILEFIRAKVSQKNLNTITLVSFHKPEFKETIEICDKHFRKISEKRLTGWYPDWTFVMAYAVD